MSADRLQIEGHFADTLTERSKLSGQCAFMQVGTAATHLTPGQARRLGEHLIDLADTHDPTVDLPSPEALAIACEIATLGGPGGCGRWHDLMGRCERMLTHAGVHARIPRGAVRPVAWQEVSDAG